MPNLTPFDLRQRNTLNLPCQGARVLRVSSVDEALDVLNSWSDIARPLVIGLGSNLVLPEILDDPVLIIDGGELHFIKPSNNEITVVADAGVIWDELVAQSVKDGWRGIENLSLIPGTVGAAPVQNIGAYGVELRDSLSYVEVFYFDDNSHKRLRAQECGFAYRDSIFKREPKRFVVLRVAIRLRRDSAFTLGYGELKALASQPALTVQGVRDKVIAVRQAKLPDPVDIPNAGSFFKNPIVSADEASNLAQRFPGMVQYALANGQVKLAAGWLIDQAGWKGHCSPKVGIHERQALVLTNLGGATQADVLELAKLVYRSVLERYGVALEIEPVVVSSLL